MKRPHYIIAALIAVVPLLSSCRQDLCYDHYPTLDVNFTWEQEWERDYGQYHFTAWDTDHYGMEYDELRPDIPEWVNVVNYYKDGGKDDSFMPPEGKRLMVDAGRSYSMLLYNGDTEYIVLSDIASLTDARATATSRTRSRASLAAMQETYNNARTTNPPDILYSAYIENVPVLNNHDVKDMPIKMQPLVYTYFLKLDFEYGIEKVALARGALAGMAESVYLRTGVTSEQSAIILFDCEVKDGYCQAAVHSFGAPGFPDAYYGRNATNTADRPYTLNLELKLRSGRNIEFDYDIADQLKNQPRGGVITIGGIRIEDDPNEPTSGFEVTVTEWDDEGEVIELPVGPQQPAQ